MKTTLTKISLGITLLTALSGFSQSSKIQPCETFAAMEDYFKSNPEARKKYEASAEVLNKQSILNEANFSTQRTAAVQYTIPVVFHILHTGGPENISDAAINTALAQVNSDFSAAGSDFSSIFAPFRSIYINSDIKFMLAKKDPNGNCTNGIVHRYDTRTLWDRNQPGATGFLFNGITWNSQKYLNVIIVKDIVAAAGQNGTVIGYTYLPGTWGNGPANQDAIVYNYSFLSGLSARSLSHEIGHWLNLSHTFGNTNNPGISCGSTAGGDGVSDTPDTKGNFSTCPASSTNTAFTCTSPNPANANNYYQNVENIMDYSSCPKNFTTGQTNRMRTALQSATAGRNNLWSAGNLAFTDINNTLGCAPIADFLSTSGYTVCSGGSLLMKDFSYNAVITNYVWTADNGAVIANPTSSNTSISFPTPGVTTITLTVGSSQGVNSKVRTVTVLNGQASITGPYSESFESPGTPANWSVINPNGLAWNQTYLAAKDGNASFFIAEGNAAGEKDYLVMPMMDVLNNPNDTLTFMYAYARQTSTHADNLLVQASTDCGGSWRDIVSLSAGTMASGSGGVTTNPFVPTSNQWKKVDVTSYPNWFYLMNSPSVVFRFVFTEDATNGNGNRLYIDAVNFNSSITGLNELTKLYRLNLFPNPTSHEATLKFNLNDPAIVSINVIDILGKNVLPTTINNYIAGEQTISINKNNTLSKGIYFVNLTINGAKMTKKLVIN
jgi:hypothetical protein